MTAVTQSRETFATGLHLRARRELHDAAHDAYPGPDMTHLRVAFLWAASRRLKGEPVRVFGIPSKDRAASRGIDWAADWQCRQQAADELSDHLFSTMAAAMRAGRAS